MTVAPDKPIVDTNHQDYCVVRNLTLRNGTTGILLRGTGGGLVEHCNIDPADFGIVLDEGAKDCVVRYNSITMNPYSGADPQSKGSWDNWQAMKIGGFYDRVGIDIKNTLGGHDIHDNYIHEHWDGIGDHGNPPWNANDPDANPNLNIHHNLIRNLNDDGMETMGPSVNGQWHHNIVMRTICGCRIKAPQKGPLYIYRNIFIDNIEDLRNWGEGQQSYPEATVWVYHNTSTSNAAVNMNYHDLQAPLTTPHYHYLNNLFWCRQWIHASEPLPLPDWQTGSNVFILAGPDALRPWDAPLDEEESNKIVRQWQRGIELAMEAGRETNSTWVAEGPSGFTDPLEGDYSLRADSPARNRTTTPELDAGKSLPGMETGAVPDHTGDAGALPYGTPMPQLPRFKLPTPMRPDGGETLIVLVGDSTVTGKTAGQDQAGWGWALQHWTTPGIRVENTAMGGRSSRSFRTEGRWDAAMALAPDWVLIQFGHNDQPGKGPERESDAETDFRDHLRRYVREAREQGAKPILVTPVCRRTYSSKGELRDSLEPYAESVRIVAEEMQVPCLDLHQFSREQFSQMAPAESRAFGPTNNPEDKTHFSTAGSTVIAQWVLVLMRQDIPELAEYFESSAHIPAGPKQLETANK
ncbi:GDSL-type esterase/lipase family protein [Ruficoccus amylovorans]|nr:GDSL-type esterase/lipase family protein [Ruficoccus amylovorans]